MMGLTGASNSIDESSTTIFSVVVVAVNLQFLDSSLRRMTQDASKGFQWTELFLSGRASGYDPLSLLPVWRLFVEL